MAAKIEPEEEFFTGESQEEMAGLRKIQASREFTEKERERFLELQTLETEAKKGLKPLSGEEHKLYLELSKKDTYTPEESAQFVALQNRLDKAGQAEN